MRTTSIVSRGPARAAWPGRIENPVQGYAAAIFETALRVLSGLAADGRARPGGRPRSQLHAALLLEWGEARRPASPGRCGPS